MSINYFLCASALKFGNHKPFFRQSFPSNSCLKSFPKVTLLSSCFPPFQVFDGTIEAMYLRLDDILVRIPKSSTSPWTLQLEDICEALKDLVPNCEDQVKFSLKALKPLSLGGLKSCLQKIIRFHSQKVSMDSEILIETAVLAAVTMALLFASKGGFSPELQLFTRGCTAAFKRLAVILLEDAWVKDDKTPLQLVALLTFGLVTQQMHDYEAPRNILIASMRLAARAAASRYIIAWRPNSRRGTDDETVVLDEEQRRAVEMSARMLRLLRSFPGPGQAIKICWRNMWILEQYCLCCFRQFCFEDQPKK